VKRLFIALAVLLVIAFIVTGCGTATTTTTTSATTAPAVITTKPAATTTAAATSAQPTVPAVTTAKPTTTSAPVVTPPAAGKSGGTLRVIEIAAPGAPLGAEWEGNLGTYNTQQWSMERMLKEKLDGGMQAELAESWEVTASGNNPNILFKLRKGVTFHDGTPCDAKAIAWNLKIFKDTGTFTATTNYWKSWDIVDDTTIRVNLTMWRNTMLRSWENYFFVSPTAYEKYGIEYMRVNMIGTGAFKQTKYSRDVALDAVKYTNYWMSGKPYLDGVQLLYVADELTREALFKSGGAEMLNSTTKQAQRFQSAEYKILLRDGGPTMLAPDSKNASSPYSNLKVRMAVEYAIDRDSLAKTFSYGFGAPAYQMSSAATLAYDKTLEAKARKFDAAKAKQLLTEGGYPNGFKTKILVAPGSDRDPVIAIQAYLSKIGIQAELEFPQPAAWQATTTQAAPLNSMIYIPLNEWSNYNTTLNVFFSGLGFYLPSNKKPDGYAELFEKTLTSAAPDATLLKQVNNSFFDDCTIIPLVYSTFVYILKPTVMDSGLGQFGTANAWDYANIWLSK
jgi:peptide/nickel transport system substrate-binding protein